MFNGPLAGKNLHDGLKLLTNQRCRHRWTLWWTALWPTASVAGPSKFCHQGGFTGRCIFTSVVRLED